MIVCIYTNIKQQPDSTESPLINSNLNSFWFGQQCAILRFVFFPFESACSTGINRQRNREESVLMQHCTLPFSLSLCFTSVFPHTTWTGLLHTHRQGCSRTDTYCSGTSVWCLVILCLVWLWGVVASAVGFCICDLYKVWCVLGSEGNSLVVLNCGCWIVYGGRRYRMAKAYGLFLRRPFEVLLCQMCA